LAGVGGCGRITRIHRELGVRAAFRALAAEVVLTFFAQRAPWLRRNGRLVPNPSIGHDDRLSGCAM
jgi:hypothetical protein